MSAPEKLSQERFDLVGFIMDYENGRATDEEVVAGFQAMLDSGAVWQLQGSYGRMAAMLCEQGICHWPNRLDGAPEAK